MLLPESLYQHIPKKVAKWSARDVEKWFHLHRIQISNQFSFADHNFDGKQFLKTTPEYLTKTCGISSYIIVRKIIEWIQYDRQQFEEYVQQHPQEQSTQQVIINPIEPPSIKQYSTQRPPKHELEYGGKQRSKENTPKVNLLEKHCDSIVSFQVQKWKKRKMHTQQSILVQKKPLSRQSSNRISNKSQNCIPLGANFVKSSYEMVESMIQFRFQQKSQFLNNSGKIGRNTDNDIIIVADSVSRKHAEIIKDQQQFYLKDQQSKFGTFIRIGTKHRRLINEGDLIIFEDSEIEILKFKYNKANNIFDLRIRKFGEQQFILNFYGKKSLIIGRDSKDIGFTDPKIHINHAKISCEKGQLVITQQSGRCFRRLSKDQIVKLENESQSIRLGLTQVSVKIISNHKAVPSITQFECLKY